MARGPRISKAAKRVIVEEALKYKGTATPRMTVVERLKPLIDPYVGQMPADETIANLVSWAWNHEPNPLDDPWCLGASAQYSISPEANEDLLKIWKRCVVIGWTVSIREAQWVARLRGLVPFEHLLYSATHYAKRERVCEVLREKTFDTTDLDTAVAFRGDLHRTPGPRSWLGSAVEHTGATGQTPRSIILLHYASLLQPSSAHTHEKHTWLTLMDEPAGVNVEAYLDLNCEHHCELTEEADMVYALWLRLLSKGPDWSNKTHEAQEEIACRLYQEVEMASANIKSLWNSRCEHVGSKEWILAHGPSGTTWAPSSELFKDVGFEVREQDISFEDTLDDQPTEWRQALARIQSLPHDLPKLARDRQKK